MSNFLQDDQILALILSEEKKDEGYRWLIRKYQERLYAFIRKMTKNHEDTDDVLQNTFIKILKNIDKFEQKSSLSTWMYKIATNETLNYIDSRKRKSTQEWQNHLSRPVNDSFDENKATQWLNEAIDTLPDKQKMVFHLRYYDEMPYHQIASITETSEGALKASYHHAVKKIESYLMQHIHI